MHRSLYRQQAATSLAGRQGFRLLAAIENYYLDWRRKRDYRTRVLADEAAMEQIHRRYADDYEGALFYALAINASVRAVVEDGAESVP